MKQLRSYLLLITLCWINGVISMAPEECEKMLDRSKQLENRIQQLRKERAGLGWFAFVTQRCRVNEINDEEIDQHNKLARSVDYACGCSEEIKDEIFALFAKIAD